ncbi:hypothetical protein L3X38_036547 [Prunus dulcis]|uniref:C2 domain-containing protein n=1 Tax=Prunus dulcis TaxID=3755 RepID=A0AAD4YPS3_PRUDU|nr:hypothetical protein L3X38_036547 [Prunus dulcis]
MAENSDHRKLIVEVCNAKNLMPKDGQGTASAYAIVDFDGQRRRTKTKQRDLNPEWDEKLEFLVHDNDSMASEILEINLYNDKKTGKRNTFPRQSQDPRKHLCQNWRRGLGLFPVGEAQRVFSDQGGNRIENILHRRGTLPRRRRPAAKAEENKKVEAKTEEKPKEEEAKSEEKPKSPEDSKPKTEEASAPPPEVENPPIAYGSEKSKQVDKEKHVEANGGINEVELLQPLARDRSRSAYDLVDRMPFLYVRVVKAKRGNGGATAEPVYAKLVIGMHSIKTKTQPSDKEWDQVFAFDKEGLNSTSLEVSVWAEAEEKKENEPPTKTETSLGTVSFDLQEVPKRVPPDSPLAPQWYTLESEKEAGNDVMLAVWIGTQADEAFQEAWQSDSGGLIPETRAKVYLSPKLWYLRLTVIQTQDLQLASGSEPKLKVRSPELYVKAQLGAQLFKTSRTSVGSTSSSSANPTWNEDLVFVAAEPFEPFLVLTVEDVTDSQTVGHAKLHVRFSCSSWLNLIQAYTSPILPRMHYVRPLGPAQQDILRHTAMRIVTARLARSEPPLGQEVVQFMLDSDTHVWSMRRSKANWFRVVGCLSSAAMFARWLDGIRTWQHPPTTVLVHVLLVAVVLCPHLVFPTVFMYAFLILLLRCRYRQRAPPNMDPRISYVDAVSPDELDEELDGFPSTRPSDVIRIRYDRLRALGGRAQTLLGDVGSARFHDDMPSVPVNFFRRLPSLSDQIM